ncbi:MAG: PEP-utilizing enzyme [Chloroflexi bacterium]|nr:PEP-utilizing enzyme [Chloroflexota bacterium]
MSDTLRSFAELTTDQQPAAGGKGGSLARLSQAGYPVPDGFVILPSAFDDAGLKPEAWAQAQLSLARLRAADHDLALAVRSSALSEDSAQASFAGEFETVLNVRTDEEIRQAIHTVYHSRHSARVQAYSQAKGMSAVHEIAVIVQQLVRADSSGVLFTANPVTGQRDQAMISAAWGMGEAIVGGLVTPDTLIVDKATGRVLARETADKQVMTVLLGSGTREQPVPEPLRRAPVLSDAQAAELVQLAGRIETLYGMPMDIEWALAEKTFAILQARPITALPDPEPPAPTEWKVPKGVYAAMRNNIVELMANPLTPLFDTLGRTAINTSFNRLMAAFFGKPGMIPEELIISVNGYAYNNGSLKAGQLARVLLGSVGIMKRMFTGAVARWTDVGRPRYVTTVARWQAQPWRQLPAIELLDAVRGLAEAAIDAYGALVSGVIPAAWISEALFTTAYNRLIQRRGDPPAPTYLLGFDSAPILGEKALYDLAEWVRMRAGHSVAAYLKDAPAAQLAAQLGDGQTPQDVDADDWREFQSRFQAHLTRYGHAIYDLDFANPVPADDPAPLLETCKMFINGQGVNPHARQQAAAERREQATQAMLNKSRGLRLRLFRKFLAPAQRYAPLREDGLADVGLGYPLLRQMLRELGRRFTEGGLIATPDDIFWLKQSEVEQAAAALDRGQPLEDLSTIVPERRATWRAARRITPPMMLPQMKFLGKDLGALKTGRKRRHSGDSIKGVAASPGRVTAPACVLHGPEDFHLMRVGDVLVAAITTPAWTPLFARAAAVVTDVGGPLSHGSIVAREYGIPAVLGTGAATERIRSGQVITVDGSAGVVTLTTDGGSGR